MKIPLPVDSILPQLREILTQHQSVVIEAPPGTGKTTRVPPALLEIPGIDGDVVVLEPRRLAARMSARFVARERGEAVGQSVGYQVRFEKKRGPETRLHYITEGILARRLLSEPQLAGVSAVVLDEFHERHLTTDLALTLLCRLQSRSRPDLKLVVMSATLDPQPLARFLGDCPIISVDSPLHPVSMSYLPNPAAEPLGLHIKKALSGLVEQGHVGDILVFLPGMADIRAAERASQQLCQRAGIELCILHGSLPAAEQDRAVTPSRRQKVILSTNVAETSITIPGVSAVIDSGLARIAGHSAWSGLPTLQTRRISKASAEQRTGRAGRTAPGHCVRLYGMRDFAGRDEYELPEIKRVDLTETLLTLHAMGIPDPTQLNWFDAPEPLKIETAEQLLLELGALETGGALSEIGQKMSRLPLHPRLSRLLIEAQRLKIPDLGQLAAAVASELSRLDLTDKRSGRSDLLTRLEAYLQVEASRFSNRVCQQLGFPAGLARRLQRVAQQLGRKPAGSTQRNSGSPPRRSGTPATRERPGAQVDSRQEEGLLFAILAGFPDRVARRQADGSLLLCGGIRAELSPHSTVREAEFLVAIDTEEKRDGRGRKVLVRQASAIDADWLLDLSDDQISEEIRANWNASAERVEVFETMRYRDLAISEARSNRFDAPEVSACLAAEAIAAGPRAFLEQREALDNWLNRLSLLARTMPDVGFPTIGESEVEETLRELCVGRRSFKELREAGFLATLALRLDPKQRQLLGKLAPTEITLPCGRRLTMNYEIDRSPWVSSRLQDFFGMRDGPTVANGRVAVVLHLLAPNKRPVQVTGDLHGFWERHYPTLRKQLSRRYPKHSWPEDGANATPPKPGRLR